MNMNDDESSSSRSGNNSSGSGSSAGRIRRRPPTAPYIADGGHTSLPPPSTHGQSQSLPSHQYGTYEGDSLLRHAPDSYLGGGGRDDQESQQSHQPYPETYGMSSSSFPRRRHHSQYASAWYRQPQKLILVATFAWIGGVMYLASLAHSILRTQKAAMHHNMMGISNTSGGGGVAGSGGAVNGANSMGSSSGRSSGKMDNNKRVNVRFGMEDSSESEEDFNEWWEEQKANKYGASAGSVVSQGGGIDVNYESYLEWLHSLTNDSESSKNAYGASSGNSQGNDQDTSYEAFLEWVDTYQAKSESSKNKYGASSGSNQSGKNDANYEAFLEWLESMQTKSVSSKNKYGSTSVMSQGGGIDVNYEAYLEWLDSLQGKSQNTKNKYGASNSDNGDSASDDEDFKTWLKNFDPSNPDADMSSANAYGNSKSNNNGRSGNRADNDSTYKEFLEYQTQTANVKYGANGMYGDESKNARKQVRAEVLTQTLSDSSSSSSQQAESATPELLTADLSTVSTIDWPMRLAPSEGEDGSLSNNNLRLPHLSCTAQNGCTPSSNVTVLVVYGPEYHTHISEMAWNVATGVHSALKSHIQHHPDSPLHGHIVYGHTSNLTFLDVMDADAIIIGSPVYNGNVHPDVQNWINYWHIDADLSNKFGGAFVTAGGMHAGADGTIMSILRSMMVFQMMAVGGDSWTSPFGVAATMYEDPFGDVQRSGHFNKSCYFTEEQGRQGDHLVHPYFLSKARGLGERIANVTVAWKNSSYVRW